MKLEINIEKKAVLFLAVLVIGITIIGLVVAYTSGWGGEAGDPTNPPIMGHSADEMNVWVNGSLKTMQQAIDDKDFGAWSCAEELEIISTTGNERVFRLSNMCMNGSGCKLLLAGEDLTAPVAAVIFDFLQESSNVWYSSQMEGAGINGDGERRSIADTSDCRLKDDDSTSGQGLGTDDVVITGSTDPTSCHLYLCK